MNITIKHILLCLLSVLSFSVLYGCKTEKRMVYADYIMPPKVVSDVSKIQTMIIPEPKIIIRGSGINRRTSRIISTIFSNTIKNDFSSKLYYNGYIKAADNIYCNSKGLRQIGRDLSGSKHGYDIKIVPPAKPARMIIKANLSYDRTEGRDRINTTLTTTNFTTRYTDKGVPFSKVSSQNSRVVTNLVPFINIKVKGSLSCTIYDSNNKVIYSRTFSDLEFENKSGGDSESNAEPPYPAVAQELFTNTVNQITTDISPHKETRALVVNEKGDSAVVALIKGTAFYDALNRLGNILDKESAQIEKESSEINAEYDKRINEEPDAEKQAALEQERKAELVEATKDFSPDFENMGIILEILGDRNEALEYYSIASDYNPENQSAKDSLTRVQELVNASSSIENPNKLDNYKRGRFQEN